MEPNVAGVALSFFFWTYYFGILTFSFCVTTAESGLATFEATFEAAP